jgi:hypothetical protein
MARARRTTKTEAPGTRRRRAVNIDTMRSAAEGFLTRFDALVAEIVSLREELAASEQVQEGLRAELAEGVELFRQAETALGNAGAPERRQGSRNSQLAAAAGSTSARRSATAARTKRTSRTRTTPETVTADVVRSVIEARGTATAGEIAADIAKGGTQVSGRAIRHIAKSAGAIARPGNDGRMVYSLT